MPSNKETKQLKGAKYYYLTLIIVFNMIPSFAHSLMLPSI